VKEVWLVLKNTQPDRFLFENKGKVKSTSWEKGNDEK
jgi:hypothetical protein